MDHRVATPPLITVPKQIGRPCKISLVEKVWECTVKLISTLIPARPPQIYCSRGVEGQYEFIKLSSIPLVKSSINLCANIFVANYESYVFQDNCMKNDNILSVTLQTSYAVDICCESWDTPFPDPSIWFIVALGGQTSNFSHLTYHLPSLPISPFRWIPVFWCTQSW